MILASLSAAAPITFFFAMPPHSKLRSEAITKVGGVGPGYV